MGSLSKGERRDIPSLVLLAVSMLDSIIIVPFNKVETKLHC